MMTGLGIDAIAQRHDRQRLGRREHRAMAAARMVGMAVRHRGARGGARRVDPQVGGLDRSAEHKSELQSLMRISYAVFCLKKTTNLSHAPRTSSNICPTATYRLRSTP